MVPPGDGGPLGGGPPGPPKGPPPRPIWLAVWGAIALILLFGGGFYFQQCWILPFVALMVVVLLSLIGYAIVGRPLGVLIDSHNLMSLSRLQLVIWTIVFLGSYISFALTRLRLNTTDTPLDILIDPHLIALVGLGAASFVGSPLVADPKKAKQPQAAATQKTADVLGENKDTIDDNREGILYVNNSPADAEISDLFQGDEIGNTHQVDLGKVQLFFFTICAALAYLVAANKTLCTGGCLDKLPVISEGVVYILGVSHASFLVMKGQTHTPLDQRS